MKAISLKQPWANLVACGYKTLETRTWTTSYRGELLICSSASGEIEPTGCALALVNLVDCREMEDGDAEAACILRYPEAKVFVLEDIRLLQPFPVRGSLNIYDLDVSEETRYTLGVNLRPEEDTVLKLDYEVYDQDDDSNGIIFSVASYF